MAVNQINEVLDVYLIKGWILWTQNALAFEANTGGEGWCAGGWRGGREDGCEQKANHV